MVITNQRFNGLKTLEKYTNVKYYKHSFSRYRLNDNEFKKVETITDNTKNVYICDRKGKGCLECGLCATLNGHKGAEISSINLSTSGICKFNCPDCYAKTMQNFLIKCGNSPISFDKILKNKKQKGKTKHILSHKK